LPVKLALRAAPQSGRPAIESEDASAARPWGRLARRAGALRWGALVLLALYAVLSLAPFDWHWPAPVRNGAIATDGGWSFPSAGIVLAAPPLDRAGAAIAAETLDVSLEARSHEAGQTGPARILTISADAYESNLTLAQEGDDLVLRLRSAASDEYGNLDGRPVARLRDVLAAGEWIAIDLRLRPGRLTLAIDGVTRLSAALPAAVLATWNTAFPLALGNETTCNRPWRGDIRNVVITRPDGAMPLAQPGEVELPATCRPVEHPPKLVPFVPFYLDDVLLNILMYVPLGCLLGLLARRRDRRTFAVLVLTVAGVSLAFETAQLLLPSRFPSVDDLICNTLGGALGIWLGLRLRPRLAAWLPAR
jgi:VanZ like family